MLKRMLILFLMVLIGSCVGGGTFLAAYEEQPPDKCFTLLDENNNVIHQTGSKVYTGDEYISASNGRYKVVEIIGNTARCKYQGDEKMPVLSYDKKSNAWNFNSKEQPVVAGKRPTVAVYHTHSDESYVPSDGKESIEGNGGIYDVGQVMANKLQKLGFEVQYNKNNHNPHDINAYNRSRRTAASLLKKSPDTIIDVHRDAVPASQYQAQVKGKDVTKVKLVVGRSNPNMKSNLEYAKKIKSVMDKKTPGLSNGIFIGKGDYNQDLSPRAMLVEVGAHTNKKEDAEKGISLFAETLPTVLGYSNNPVNQAPAAKKPLSSSENQAAGTTILMIVIVVAAAVGGYYLLNRGTNK